MSLFSIHAGFKYKSKLITLRCFSPCRRSVNSLWGSSLDLGQRVPVRKNSIAPQVTAPHSAMFPKGRAAAPPRGVLVRAKWCEGRRWASTQQGPLRSNIQPFDFSFDFKVSQATLQRTLYYQGCNMFGWQTVEFSWGIWIGVGVGQTDRVTDWLSEWVS